MNSLLGRPELMASTRRRRPFGLFKLLVKARAFGFRLKVVRDGLLLRLGRRLLGLLILELLFFVEPSSVHHMKVPGPLRRIHFDDDKKELNTKRLQFKIKQSKRLS